MSREALIAGDAVRGDERGNRVGAAAARAVVVVEAGVADVAGRASIQESEDRAGAVVGVDHVLAELDHRLPGVRVAGQEMVEPESLE